MSGTSVVGAGNGPESLLTGGVPDLKFADFVIDIEHSEPEINTDGSEVVLDEVIIAESKKKRGLSDALVSNKNDFKDVILFFYHCCFINWFYKSIYKLM